MRHFKKDLGRLECDQRKVSKMMRDQEMKSCKLKREDLYILSLEKADSQYDGHLNVFKVLLTEVMQQGCLC